MHAIRMMPRLRLRRLLFSAIALGGLSLLAINFRFRDATSEFTNDLEAVETSRRIKAQQHADDPSASAPSPARYWFMQGGSNRPVPASSPVNLWPYQDPGDRIVQQLMYVPPNYDPENTPMKKILLYFGRGSWNDLPMGRTVFLRDNCPVSRCELTTSTSEADKADAIFFKDRFQWPKHRRHPDQIWLLFLLECPLHTQDFAGLTDVFNWTATYRHDSDIVAPYEKFVTYETSTTAGQRRRNYVQNKTKQVAWFVSNCAARNKRFQYARELSKHIPVDIYGSCGSKRCPRSQAERCFDMLDQDYKFYLAFENSNCKDYITEKFFVNGLSFGFARGRVD